MKGVFDAAVVAAQANLDQAQRNLQTLLAALPIRPPATFPQGWTRTSVAQSGNVYGNVRSWLEGMKRTTVTHGVHSVVYSPSQAPQATPAQTTPSVPVAPSPSAGSAFVTFSVPSVDPNVVPASNVAQASELYGDQYAYVGGTQYTAVTSDKTTVVAGHVSSTIRSGQDVTVSGGKMATINGGETVNVTGGKTSTVVGVNFSGTAPMNISADVMKLAMAAVTMSVHVMKIDTGLLCLKTSEYDLGTSKFTGHASGLFVFV